MTVCKIQGIMRSRLFLSTDNTAPSLMKWALYRDSPDIPKSKMPRFISKARWAVSTPFGRLPSRPSMSIASISDGLCVRKLRKEVPEVNP